MFYTILLLIHILICIGLALSILLQSSKGGGLAGVFGGGGGGGAMGSVFGGRGVASFLSKLTTGLAIAFFIVCLILGKITSGEARGPGVKQSAVQKARSSSVIPIHSPGTQAVTPAASTPAPETQATESEK